MRTLTYATNDGVPLSADFYPAIREAPTPVVVCIHGGAWKAGDRRFYRYLGAFLALAGFAVFSIDYRLVAGDRNRLPAAADDVRSALQYLRDNAAELHVDPARIAVMGDSAGAHLAALIALTEPGAVRALIGVYGVYDLAAQWLHDRVARPGDNIAEGLLGVSLTDDRRAYFDASPLSYATRRSNAPSVLLAWGTLDDIVDPAQSERFRDALKAAGFFVRTIVQTAPHFWIDDPLDEPGSFTSVFAPRLVRFLEERLR